MSDAHDLEPDSHPSPRMSRRLFLGAAALGVGASGAMVAAGSASAASPSDYAEQASGRSSLPRWIRGTSWRWRGTDSGQGATTGDLVDDAGRNGAFRSVPLGPGAHLHVFTFEAGSLLGLGSGLESGAFAIVGGTGAFAGWTGAYTCTQSPRELGGTGTATFTITSPGS